MPYTIHTAKAKIRDALGNFRSIDVFSNEIEDTQQAAIQAVNDAKTAALNDIDDRANEEISQYTTNDEVEAMFAPIFSTATAYTAGTYVRNANGNTNKLYRLTADHAVNTTWANTSKVEVKISNQVTDLKSAATDRIESIYITESLNTAPYAGLTLKRESANILKVYGTSTAARKILCLNGQNALKTSTMSFEKTLDAGVYEIATSVSGYNTGNVFSWQITYSTFATDNIVASISQANSGLIVKLEQPAMLGLNFASNTNFGSENDPAYITINVKKIIALDPTARANAEHANDSAHGIIKTDLKKYVEYYTETEYTKSASGVTVNARQEIIKLNGTQTTKYLGARISGTLDVKGTIEAINNMERNLTLKAGHKYRLIIGRIAGTLSITGDGAYFSPRISGATSITSFDDGDKNIHIYEVDSEQDIISSIVLFSCKGDNGSASFENYTINVLFEDITNEIITPQMYGAKGDGITDDTAAFRLAVDSGDVFVPMANNEIYRITGTVYIRNNKCLRIYSNGNWRGSNTKGVIRFDLSDNSGTTLAELRSVPLFAVYDTQMFHIDGLNFYCSSQTRESTARVGTFISCLQDTCDYDTCIYNTRVVGFYRVERFHGRGFTIENCSIASVNYIGYFTWSDDEDTNKNHSSQYDQRAIIIKNNRLHSIQSGYIHVRSGHAYGLTFANNTCDNGKGYLLSANQQAWNWIIVGNLVQGVSRCQNFIRFRDGARNCNISNNIFVCDDAYWLSYKDKDDPNNNVSSTIPPLYWIHSDADMDKCNITGNIFKGSQYSPIYLENASNNIITSNVFDKIGATPGNGIDDDSEHEGSDESGDSEEQVVLVYGVISVKGAFNYNIYAFNNGTSQNANVHSIEYESGATQQGNVIENNFPI